MSNAILSRIPGGRLLVGIAISLAVLLIAARILSGFYVEVLWFASTGFSSVFWTRILWEWGVRALVTGLAALVALVNLRMVASTLGAIRIRRRFGNLEISEQLPRSYVAWALAITSIVFGIWFGAAVPGGTGLRTLLWLNAPEWGLADPIFGHSAGFYVFALPLLGSALSLGLALVFLVFALSLAGYSATASISLDRGKLRMSEEAQRHLVVLGCVFLLLLALRFWLTRYFLLVDGTSAVQGIYGYTDARARTPALQALAFITLLSAGGLFWGSSKRRPRLMVASAGTVLVAWIVIGQVYPTLIQSFRVQPNELDLETPYIEHNLEFTRQGFGIHEVTRSTLDYQPPSADDWNGALEQLSGLPVWSRSALEDTYRELEARFQYYRFSDVAIDRYSGPDGPVPVAVSVREVDATRIPDANWQNLHLRERYVRGLGAVASEATSRTPEGRPTMLLSEIPPSLSTAPGTPPGLALERSAVFFGAGPQRYAIINPTDQAFLSPEGGRGEAGLDYPSGIVMSSMIRTLALAWRFRDANLLFASEISASSRFVFRRRVLERLREIAPFIRFPSSPYPVVSDGRVVWVVEGYTDSPSFPLSADYSFEFRRPISYIRNSVKATVDAVSGEVNLYAADPEDPILVAYRSVFPELIQDLTEMPANLLEHIRYPRGLMLLQSRVLEQYHQNTAPVFHGAQDVWSVAQELTNGTAPVEYEPEYGRYRLPGESAPEFLLSTVFVPEGRQNLTALFVARSDPERYGELLLFDVPVEDRVPGPRQVEALVEQDPVLSQQFSLWRQGGSQVLLGHLHLVPVGQSLLYMEPIFLAAEEGAIPELRRFIVSDGRRVSMESSLELALQGLTGEGAEGVAESAGVLPSSSGSATDLSLRALELLEQAELYLRRGDWAGYGARLQELRSLLEANRGPGGGS